MVYRRGIVPEFPTWFDECEFRDWPLHALHAAQGDIIFHDDILATWRLHGGGRWTGTAYAQRLAGAVRVRERIWREVGSPDNLTTRRLRASGMATLAACASSREEAFRLLRGAVRIRPAVAHEGIFLYALARMGLGNTAALAILREVSRRRGEPRALGPG